MSKELDLLRKCVDPNKLAEVKRLGFQKILTFNVAMQCKNSRKPVIVPVDLKKLIGKDFTLEDGKKLVSGVEKAIPVILISKYNSSQQELELLYYLIIFKKDKEQFTSQNELFKKLRKMRYHEKYNTEGVIYKELSTGQHAGRDSYIGKVLNRLISKKIVLKKYYKPFQINDEIIPPSDYDNYIKGCQETFGFATIYP